MAHLDHVRFIDSAGLAALVGGQPRGRPRRQPARTGTITAGGTTPMAVTDWAAAIAALSTGQLPCSAERRLLRLAASLGEGIPVDLQDALTSLDDVRLELVTTAIRHAAGRRPATWTG